MIEKVTRYIKLRRKYNTLETKYEVLYEDVKNKCFDKILDKLSESIEIESLRDENKRLRNKIKMYKEELNSNRKTFRAKK